MDLTSIFANLSGIMTTHVDKLIHESQIQCLEDLISLLKPRMELDDPNTIPEQILQRIGHPEAEVAVLACRKSPESRSVKESLLVNCLRPALAPVPAYISAMKKEIETKLASDRESVSNFNNILQTCLAEYEEHMAIMEKATLDTVSSEIDAGDDADTDDDERDTDTILSLLDVPKEKRFASKADAFRVLATTKVALEGHLIQLAEAEGEEWSGIIDLINAEVTAVAMLQQFVLTGRWDGAMPAPSSLDDVADRLTRIDNSGWTSGNVA